MAETTNTARLRLTAEDATARAIASAAQSLEKLAAQAERSAKRVNKAQGLMTKSAALASTAIGGIMAGGAAAGFAKDSFTEFANFDRTLTRIGNTAGKSREAMKGVGEVVRRIAKDVAMPSTEVARGLNDLVSSGNTLEEAMAFLPTVSKTAQAAGADITDIAKTSDALSNSFGITGDAMQKAMDTLVAGGNAGKFELKDMASYIPTLAPLMKSLGYSGVDGLRKLVAMLQVTREGTGSASEAADAFRDTMSKMLAPGTAEGFKRIGINTFTKDLEDAQKAGKDMPAWFLGYTRQALALTAATKGIKDPLSIIPQVFGDLQNQIGMRALLQTPGAIDRLAKSLHNVDGSTIKALGEVTSDARASADRLEESWTGVQRSLGKALDAAGASTAMDKLVERIEESIEGLEQIARLGLGGAVSRAFNRDNVKSLDADRAAKAAEVEAATSPAQRDRLMNELRELEGRVAVARGRFERSDNGGKPGELGLPGVVDLPGPLSPELTPGQRATPGPAPRFVPMEQGFTAGEPAPFTMPEAFESGAQEDTLKNIERDTGETKSLWKRLFGNTSVNQPGQHGLGGLIQKASLGSDDAVTGSTPVERGFGGSGVAIGEGGGGGGTAGTPNMRYGGQSAARSGSGGTRGASGRTGGGGLSGGSAPQGTGRGTRGAARTGEMMRVAMDQLRREGVPEAQLRTSAAHLVGQATMESGLDPTKSHDGGTGYGLYGARDPNPGRGRRTNMLNWMKANGYAANSAEGQMRFMVKEAMSGEYGKTRAILMGKGTGNLDADTNTITGEFERPKYINKRSGAVAGALAIGPQDAGTGESSGDTAMGGGDAGALRVKGGMNGQAFAGGATMPGTIAAARDFQRDGLPGGVSHFSAFNDRYHQGTRSKHASGLAFDTTLASRRKEDYAKAKVAAEARLRESGLDDRDFKVIDEANNPSARSTGDHLHTQFNSPEAAAQYNAWSAKKAEERAAQAKAKAAPKVEAKAAPPSLEQGGTGFKPAGDMEGLKARHDALRGEMEKPIKVRVEPQTRPMERIRERSGAQARREMDREVRNARGNSYSDVGVA